MKIRVMNQPSHYWPAFILLFLFTVLLPFKPYGIISYGYTFALPDFALLGAGALVVVGVLTSERLRFPKPLVMDAFLITGIVGAAIISTTSQGSSSTWEVFRLLTWLGAVYGLSALIPFLTGDVTPILQALIIAACIATAIAIGQSFLGLFLELGRPAPARSIGGMTIPFGRSAGPYGTYGRFGMLLLAAFPLLLFSALEFERQSLFSRKPYLYVLLVTVSLGIIISQTRGTWVAAGSVTFLTLFVHYRRVSRGKSRRPLRLAAILLLVPVTGGGLWLLARMNINTVLLRIEQYAVAVRLFLKNPLFGIGYQNFIPLARDLGVEMAVHNVFFIVLVSMGIVGTVVFGAFVTRVLSRHIRIFVQTLDSGRIEPVSVTISLFGVFLQAQVVPGLYAQELWLVMGLVTATYFVHFYPEEGHKEYSFRENRHSA